MDDRTENERRPRGESNSKAVYDTLEADVLEESKKATKDGGDEEVRLSDAAVTAEFDYIDIADESEGADESKASDENKASEETQEAASASPPMAGINKKSKKKPKMANNDGPITRALNDFDSFLDGAEDDDLGSQASGPELKASDASLSAPGAWGYDQPQVSGVFSRYEEETEEGDSDEFDLFDEEEGEEPRERTLQEIVVAHEKQVRQLEKRVVYQKEVIQVVSELLVEARVISKRELKKRLRALRDKSS